MTAQVAKQKGFTKNANDIFLFAVNIALHKINDMKDLQVDYSDDPRAVRIAAALWWYYVSKLYELLGILV